MGGETKGEEEMDENMVVAVCCVCGRHKQPDGTWDFTIVDGVHSHGYCPECIKLERIKLIRSDIPALANFSRSLSDVANVAVNLKFSGFTAELVDDGFILKFENGMELGLREFMGSIFYHARDEFGRYSGTANPAKMAGMIYKTIIDFLLTLPAGETAISVEAIPENLSL